MARNLRAANSHTWRDWLGDNFFCRRDVTRPVVYCVDADALLEISGGQDPGIVAAALAGVVESDCRLRSDPRGGLRELAREQAAWKRKEAAGYPPCLPLLAVTVLAASRMVTSEQATAQAYWFRFHELVGTDSACQAPLGEYLPGFWDDLAWWLDEVEVGARGLSTAQTHPHFTVIGYALSQAMFREVDRTGALPVFFAEQGLPPGRNIDDWSPYLPGLRSWAPSAGLSAGALSACLDVVFEPYLAGVLGDALARWGGATSAAPRVGQGGPTAADLLGSFHLHFSTGPPGTWELVVRRPPAFPDGGTFTGGGVELALEPSRENEWFDGPLGLGDLDLRGGLSVSCGAARCVWESRDLRVLKGDPVWGGWTEVQQVLLGDLVRVVAAPEISTEVEAFLGENVQAGWTSFAARGGWVCFADVVIGGASNSGGDPRLAALLPLSKEPSLSIQNGLRLPASGRPTYLRGGEPDLVFPAASARPEVIEIDGQPHQADASGALSTGWTVTLRKRQIDVGHHVARAHPFPAATFSSAHAPVVLGHTPIVLATLGAFDGTATSFGDLQELRECPLPGSGRAVISGGAILGDPDALPGGGTWQFVSPDVYHYWVLGAIPGEIIEDVGPGSDGWCEDMIGLQFSRVGLDVPFAPMWMITETALQGLMVTRLGGMAPAASRTASGLLPWCAALSTAADSAPRVAPPDQVLWDAYLRTARESHSDALGADDSRSDLPTSLGFRAAGAVMGSRSTWFRLRVWSREEWTYASSDGRFEVTYSPGRDRWVATTNSGGATRCLAATDSLVDTLTAVARAATLPSTRRARPSREKTGQEEWSEPDLLLEWLTVWGKQSWSQFRDRAKWLIGQKTGSALRVALDALGHIEVLWSTTSAHQLVITPPTLVAIPGVPGVAVLTGARTRLMVGRLASADGRVEVVARRQANGLLAIWAVADDGLSTTLRQWAVENGLGWSSQYAERVAAALPPLSELVDRCPRGLVSGKSEVKRYVATTGQWSRVSAFEVDGLYRWKPPQRTYDVYALQAHGVTRDLGPDRDLAFHAEAGRLGSPLVEIRGGPSNRPVALHVQGGCNLPRWHSRIAVLCAGVLPAGGVYHNVPPRVATAIVDSLAS